MPVGQFCWLFSRPGCYNCQIMGEGKLKVGIVGASGYSGEVLLKVLAGHSGVDLAAVTSRKHAGAPIAEVVPALRGRLAESKFIESQPAALAARQDIDVWFLALPHGVAAAFARPLVQAGKRVIDLSADFRLNSEACYQAFYGKPHPDPALMQQARYVLPEIEIDDAWREAPLIACPGCYPTSVLVPLVPLLRDEVIGTDQIVIYSLSGVSGAGKQAQEYYSFCERAESCLPYGIPKHRHLSEIEEQLSAAARAEIRVQFLPHLVPMRRGIVTTITVPAHGKPLATVYSHWASVYNQCPFICVLPPGVLPDTAHVVGTNRIDIAATYDARTDNFIFNSAEDNLLKGASGQAVQIMNRWFQLPEILGLVQIGV